MKLLGVSIILYFIKLLSGYRKFWVTIAINNQNLNKSFVFIFTCVIVCTPS